MESRNGSMTGAASSAAPSRPARDETATVMLPGQERYPPYREEVSAIVVNHAGGVFFGIKRNNMLSLPEGGVIRGEWPIEALWRELEEETGIKSAQVSGVTTFAAPIFTDFSDFSAAPWKFSDRYRGKVRHVFLVRFTGQNSDIHTRNSPSIKIAPFSGYQWLSSAEIMDSKAIDPGHRDLVGLFAWNIAAFQSVTHDPRRPSIYVDPLPVVRSRHHFVPE